jgi:hypothetical protein
VTRFFRAIVYVMSAGMVAFAAVVLHVNGHLPASVPSEAPEYRLSDLGDALRAVDRRGVVDLVELKKRHASLETFVASMAATSPDTTPERFPTVEARLAYWLNAFHALSLLELLDTREAVTSSARQAFDVVPIGGRRLGRFAIYSRFLSQSGDARVFLAVFTGAKGRGVLDGAPFDPDTLNPQLDDAVRRFMQRKEVFHIEGKVVKVSSLLRTHESEFLAALPEQRKNVLQIVWAYLPETCDDDKPGCDTRSDLDRACGNRFDACEVSWVPVDETLAVKN